eukprot:scaffold25862_cov152-Cylindrotheca_fusiformis.AAC.2
MMQEKKGYNSHKEPTELIRLKTWLGMYLPMKTHSHVLEAIINPPSQCSKEIVYSVRFPFCNCSTKEYSTDEDYQELIAGAVAFIA